MVTRREKPAVSAFTRDLARIVKGLMRENGVTQVQVAKAIGKSQPYVSDRVNGLDAWNTLELEGVATLLGFETAFDLLDVVRVRLGV